MRYRGRAAAGLALTIATAACGGHAGGGAAGTAGAGTATAVTGGTLTIGEQQAPNSMNPAEVDQNADFTVVSYDALTYLASDGKLEPALATSWHYVGTGNRKLDLTLREGVKFSDGSPVTAAAVRASLEYAKSAQGDQAQYLAGSTITVTGPLSLSITLSQPDPMLPTLLSQAYGIGQIIGPKGLANPATLDAGHVSDGAGPYVYDPAASVAGDHYTYTATPGYYDKSRQRFKKIVIRVMPNEQSGVDATETGQIDVYKGDFGGIAQAKAAHLTVTGSPDIWEGLNLADRDGSISKPLASLKVRQAINYAVDRPAVTQALLGAYGTPTDETVTKGSDGYSAKDADYYPYDPAKARQLLKEAGYPNGFTLNVLTATFAGFNTLAQALQAELAKVGIKLNLTVASQGPTYVTDTTGGQYPAIVEGFTEYPVYLQAQQTLLASSTKVYNPFGSSAPALAELIERAAAASPAARTGLDEQIESYIVENAWFVPVSWTPIAYFARPGIDGITMGSGVPAASPLDWYQAG